MPTAAIQSLSAAGGKECVILRKDNRQFHNQRTATCSKGVQNEISATVSVATAGPAIVESKGTCSFTVRLKRRPGGTWHTRYVSECAQQFRMRARGYSFGTTSGVQLPSCMVAETELIQGHQGFEA